MDQSATFETVAGEAPLVRWPRVLHVVGATRPSCADPEWSQREVGVAPNAQRRMWGHLRAHQARPPPA